jgi:D-beta-D-heptose 7-phosphate kinase/D-beta-D-heptose 1-phosphate adenosyltransferase
MLEAAGVACDFVVIKDWPTILKLRVVSRQQQLLRTDFERPLAADQSEAVAARVAAHLSAATVVVLQDYDKGTLADPQAVLRAVRAGGVPSIVDPKHKPLASYAGADLVKPNLHEFEAAAGPWADDDALVGLGQAVCAAHGFNALVITRGSQGMTVVERGGVHQHVPARPVDVYDVTGAGDTAAATLAVTRSLGWDAVACAQVANVASALAVGKSGTASVTGPELALALAATPRADRGVLSRAQLLDAVAQARLGGERIVFTNGCFDILHAGHVAYLEEARALGDRLVVAVNDDASVRRLKGPGRPVNPLDRRMRVLSGLVAVDWVVGFSEDTPEPLLGLLQPDVLVKGGDYAASEVVGAEVVRAQGGEVRVLGLVADVSTTAIVERLQRE